MSFELWKSLLKQELYREFGPYDGRGIFESIPARELALNWATGTSAKRYFAMLTEREGMI